MKQQDRFPSLGSFYRVHAGVPFLLALFLFVVFEFTHLDLTVENWFFDSATGQFPLRHVWFFKVFMHRWVKYVIVAVGVVVGVCLLLSLKLPQFRRHWRVFLFLGLCLGLGPAAVAGLKAATNMHCPYDLQMYGGTFPYVRLFEWAPEGMRRGRCWPAGHASGGFALMGFYFIWWRSRPRWAHAALAFGLVYGFAMGIGRMVQGAHFLSHNFWSALVCWLVALLCYRILLQSRDFPQARGAA
ncbi:phosphatase PAP2 family protein [Nitrospina gracilis]|uniref:phosphatase PAP2 family protein n=1 Tax=Nitrospina gracilis TaxID=35801 RepID=UPI001F3C042C|nr:phosphatase PAP2 family protein [Nitrospina gracilis]MCF8719746.1 membrane-associated PAP2 superfamily phosphatase [Nitrospina gracilis Nb-211]